MFSKNKRFIAFFLSVMCTITSINVGAFSINAEPSKKKFYPKDTVTLRKIADGTHEGPGTEAFINSKNGYAVSDDTKTDGVVASGDYVTYSYNLSIAAGPKRTLRVEFNQDSGDMLELADFGNTPITSSIITSKWDGNAWVYEVPRGATLEINATFTVRAKDSKGKISKNNVVSATLKNGEYEFKTKAEPVTVVSVPLADLTIDAVNHRYSSR